RFMRSGVIKYVAGGAQAAARAGKEPGPETSLVKLAASLHSAYNGDLALQIEGAQGMLTGKDAPRRGMFQQLFVGQWGMRLGGGTEQIQRNVIGEGGVGPPGGARARKTRPLQRLSQR